MKRILAAIVFAASLLTFRTYSTKEAHGASWLWCDICVQRGFAVSILVRPLEKWCGWALIGLGKDGKDWDFQVVLHPKGRRCEVLGFVINKREWYSA